MFRNIAGSRCAWWPTHIVFLLKFSLALTTTASVAGPSYGQSRDAQSTGQATFQELARQTRDHGLITLSEPSTIEGALPEKGKIIEDMQLLELASRVYEERTRPGNYVFGSDRLRRIFEHPSSPKSSLLAQTHAMIRSQVNDEPVYHWQLVETDSLSVASPVHSDEKGDGLVSQARKSGFSAAVYINLRSKRIVIAIAGTKVTSWTDIKNDVAALVRLQPAQFQVGLRYIRSVLRRHRPTYPGFSYMCTGHSLGGGVCAYAAAKLHLPAVVLNPISAQDITGAARYTGAVIESYIDPKDFAYGLYKRAMLLPTGRIYWIKEDPSTEGWLTRVERFYRSVIPEGKFNRLHKAIEAHSVNGSLDRLSKVAGLPRLQ